MSVLIAEQYPYVTADAIAAHVAAGTTEKRAAALILRDHGVSNAEGGEAFGVLFGTPVKSGGFGNLVTGALRDVGRGGEIDSTTGGTRAPKARELDPVQMLRDELDRERVALATVTKPVDDANTALTAVADDPDKVVAVEIERMEKVIAETRATVAAIKKDAAPFLASHRERLTARRDAAVTAAGEREKVHAANIERLETVVTALTPVA